MRHEPGTTSATVTSARRAPGRGALHAPRRRRLLLAVAGVAAVVMAASASPAAFAAGATVNVATSSNFGTVLANAQGFALYTLPTDHNGLSTCTGACMPVWPALTVPAGTTPTAGTGASGTVAAVAQGDGTYQVTYNGAPLYTFVGDTSPGEVSGNNVGGFKIVQVSAAPPATTAPPTTAAPPATTTAPSTSGPPAKTTATTAATAVTTAAAGGGSTGTQVVAPATAGAPAPASTSGAPVPASSSPSATPSTLAATGPGPALVWMVVVGLALIGISVSLLLVLGGRLRLGRVTWEQVGRAGSWLLGR